ncbi:MAG: hypothetical protein ACLGQW_07780 [Acidobacteriota bacterium]
MGWASASLGAPFKVDGSLMLRVSALASSFNPLTSGSGYGCEPGSSVGF